MSGEVRLNPALSARLDVTCQICQVCIVSEVRYIVFTSDNSLAVHTGMVDLFLSVDHQLSVVFRCVANDASSVKSSPLFPYTMTINLSSSLLTSVGDAICLP